jgi:hypothetical protein
VTALDATAERAAAAQIKEFLRVVNETEARA